MAVAPNDLKPADGERAASLADDLSDGQQVSLGSSQQAHLELHLHIRPACNDRGSSRCASTRTTRILAFIGEPSLVTSHPKRPDTRVLSSFVFLDTTVSTRYTERLAEAGIEPSVGSRGDSYDNALAESVIGLYKTEVTR